MAAFALTDAFVSINGVDLSNDVKGGTLTYEAEMLDDTAMGDDTRSNLGGLKNWTMSVEFIQDFAASQVDATLFSLVGSTFTVIFRPDSGSVSATNPNFTGTGILASYTPIGNSVGDLAMAPVTINAAGTLSRATS